MNEYKFVNKMYKNNKNSNSFKLSKFIKEVIYKILMCMILLVIGLIILKYDKNSSQKIYKFIYENNISFAKINDYFTKNFGNILPFQNVIEKTSNEVFNEKLSYKELNIYNNGIKLKVDKNYLVPNLNDGVIIYIGSKENFNNTIIVQEATGVNVWYGNIINSNVNLYDYVKKGEILGMTDDNILYMAFLKDGEFDSYKNYL